MMLDRYGWPRDIWKSPDTLDLRTEFHTRYGQCLLSLSSFEADRLRALSHDSQHDTRRWMPVGPAIMTNGQAAGNPIVAGRVREIVVSPNGQRIYAGSANGGVWYSADAGQSWAPLGAWGLTGEAASGPQKGLSLTVGALDVQFGTDEHGEDAPAHDVVYVATGEIKPYLSATPGANQSGVGILRLKGSVTAALASGTGNPWQREAPNLDGTGVFRLTHDPAVKLPQSASGKATMVAATSNGLWFRDGSFVENGKWKRVTHPPFDFDANSGYCCTDVLWTKQGLWVTVAGPEATMASSGKPKRKSRCGLYRSVHGLAGPFERVALPDLLTSPYTTTRLSLAGVPGVDKRLYVLGKVAGPQIGHAALWQVDLTHDTKGHRVQNVPIGLFSSKVTREGGKHKIVSDQSNYDAAITVGRNGGRDIVFLGGSTQYSGDWEASLFRLTIRGTAARNNLSGGFDNSKQTSPATDASYMGQGTHADVHSLKLAGNDLWIGCDGGVFRRRGALTLTSFTTSKAESHNTGLSVAEPGFLECHPTLDGVILAGTQDNGTIERVGDTVWRLLSKGDGGGCAFHPTQPHQVLRQYVQADWGFIPAMDPASPALRSSTGSRTTSETNENSRSSFYGKPAVAPGATPKQARVFIGTTRIWYALDWESASKTMHWQTIPTGGSDPFGSKPGQDVLTFRGYRDPVLAIRVLHPGDTEQNFNGTKLLVLCKHTVRVFTCTSASAHASARNRWTSSEAAIVSGPTGKSKKASTTATGPYKDHLPKPSGAFWTDIAPHDGRRGSFYVSTTGKVRVNADGSLTEDTAFDVLWWYNGAGKWYPTGLRNAPVDAAFGTAGCKSPAHAVIVDPDDNKAVYVGNSIGVWRGHLDESGPHPSWTWEPLLDGLPQVLVQDLSFFKKGALKLLRAATVSRGVWECDLSDSPRSVGSCYIRSLPYDTGRATLPASPTDAIGSTRKLHLHQSPDIVLFRSGKAPWGSRLPNESEMLGAMDRTSFPMETLDAFVMVHYRHTTPLDGASVKVDLFLIKAKVADVTIDNNWRAAVIGAVNGPARPFPDGLSHLRRISPGNQVDARNPGVVKTTVNMGYFSTGQLADHATVMAVVTAPGNDLQSSDLSPPTLEEIVRKSPRIAVRQVSRRSGLLI